MKRKVGKEPEGVTKKRKVMIDMNGPDIEAVDEVKALILQSVTVWKNYKKKMPSRSTAGVTRSSRSAQGTSNVYSQLSGLEDVVFNDFIKDDFLPEGHGQVASGSASLPDPVALETEVQRLEREQNERDVLEALGDYTECDARMSVENVPAVVNIKTRKVLLDSKTKQGRFLGRQGLGTSCCCKRLNNVEKQ
jgi:hypothetical protein